MRRSSSDRRAEHHRIATWALATFSTIRMYALKLYYDTEESREGVNALKDKRKPDFRKYAK